MKIELLALLDLIDAIISEDKLEKLENEEINLLLDQYADVSIVSEIRQEIEIENYDRVLDIIEGYKVLCKEILTVYNSIQKDFSKLIYKNNLKEEIADVLNEKYGLGNIDHIIQILQLKREEVPRAVLVLR